MFTDPISKLTSLAVGLVFIFLIGWAIHRDGATGAIAEANKETAKENIKLDVKVEGVAKELEKKFVAKDTKRAEVRSDFQEKVLAYAKEKHEEPKVVEGAVVVHSGIDAAGVRIINGAIQSRTDTAK